MSSKEDLGSAAGPLIETFVGQELRKQIGWSQSQPRLFFYREDRGSREVDFVLEGPGKRLVGIEVKASGTVTGRDIRGLRSLEEAVGRRFHGGVVLHCSDQVLPLGRRLWAVPVSALWTLGAADAG